MKERDENTWLLLWRLELIIQTAVDNFYTNGIMNSYIKHISE